MICDIGQVFSETVTIITTVIKYDYRRILVIMFKCTNLIELPVSTQTMHANLTTALSPLYLIITMYSESLKYPSKVHADSVWVCVLIIPFSFCFKIADFSEV